MKKVSFIYLMILAGGIIDLGFLAMPAFAQDVPTLQKLQSIINAQQQLIEAQQKQLDAQMQSIQKLQKEVQSLPRVQIGETPASLLGSDQGRSLTIKA